MQAVPEGEEVRVETADDVARKAREMLDDPYLTKRERDWMSYLLYDGDRGEWAGMSHASACKLNYLIRHVQGDRGVLRYIDDLPADTVGMLNREVP